MGRIRVSQKGHNAELDDLRYLTLDTDKNQFKVLYEGMETFNLNSTNGYNWSRTVTHNIGYRPQVLAYGYFAEPNADFTQMVKVSEFTLLPYCIFYGTDPATASLVANISRSGENVVFKFFEQNDVLEPPPNNFTLTDMKLRYFIFIDRE